MSAFSKSRRLRTIRNANCEACPLHSRCRMVCVPGDGTARLPIMVLGEAPGYNEDMEGRPFVGRAGKLLRGELIKAGLDPKSLYLTNTVKCYPDGTPTSEEAATCSSIYLKRELEIFKPKWILAVGRLAMEATTDAKRITKDRGMIWEGPGKSLVWPTLHPAYVLRTMDKNLPLFSQDLRDFAALVSVDLGL